MYLICADENCMQVMMCIVIPLNYIICGYLKVLMGKESLEWSTYVWPENKLQRGLKWVKWTPRGSLIGFPKAHKVYLRVRGNFRQVSTPMWPFRHPKKWLF